MSNLDLTAVSRTMADVIDEWQRTNPTECSDDLWYALHRSGPVWHDGVTREACLDSRNLLGFCVVSSRRDGPSPEYPDARLIEV